MDDRVMFKMRPIKQECEVWVLRAESGEEAEWQLLLGGISNSEDALKYKQYLIDNPRCIYTIDEIRVVQIDWAAVTTLEVTS